MTLIARLEDLLAHPKKILDVIKEDLAELEEKYGDERRTRIVREAVEEFKEEDLVADEAILISITTKGYIKRVSNAVYRTQGRGRRGVIGQNVREEDEVLMMIPARTLDTILFFSDRGKVYSEKAYQIPEAGRSDRGIPVVNVLALDGNERITAVLPVPDFSQSKYCVMATARGRLKRMVLSELSSVRPSGLIAVNLDEGDELGWANLTSGKDEIIMISAGGQALRIAEKVLRPMGRQAAGVTGIKLATGDILTSMEVVEPNGFLLMVTERGYGKRTLLSEYAQKGRATRGVVTLHPKYIESAGKVAASRVVQEDDEVTFITEQGKVVRLKVKDIRLTGRSSRGVHLMDVGKEDSVASLARMFPVADQPEKEQERNPENNEV
jgi:DNA gyrase subunit A